jgi:hypothetical protein
MFPDLVDDPGGNARIRTESAAPMETKRNEIAALAAIVVGREADFRTAEFGHECRDGNGPGETGSENQRQNQKLPG